MSTPIPTPCPPQGASRAEAPRFQGVREQCHCGPTSPRSLMHGPRSPLPLQPQSCLGTYPHQIKTASLITPHALALASALALALTGFDPLAPPRSSPTPWPAPLLPQAAVLVPPPGLALDEAGGGHEQVLRRAAVVGC